MATVTASLVWDGPAADVLRLFMEPTSELVGAAVHDEDIVLFRILDEKQEPTGDIVGIEIVGFLDFQSATAHRVPQARANKPAKTGFGTGHVA